MSQAQPLSGWWWSWMWAPPTELSMTFLTAALMGSSAASQGMVLSLSHLSPPRLKRGTKRGPQTLVEWRQAREHTHSPKYSCTHTHVCCTPTGPKSQSYRQDVCPFSWILDQAVNILANRMLTISPNHTKLLLSPSTVQSMRHVSPERLNNSPNWHS